MDGQYAANHGEVMKCGAKMMKSFQSHLGLKAVTWPMKFLKVQVLM